MKNSKGVEIPKGLESVAEFFTWEDALSFKFLLSVHWKECIKKSKWDRFKDFVKGLVFFRKSMNENVPYRLPDGVAPEEFMRWLRSPQRRLSIHINLGGLPLGHDLYNSEDNQPEFIDIRV